MVCHSAWISPDSDPLLLEARTTHLESQDCCAITCCLDSGPGALPSGQNTPHLSPPCPFGCGLGPPSSLHIKGPSLPLPDPGPILTVTIKRSSGNSRYEGEKHYILSTTFNSFSPLIIIQSKSLQTFSFPNRGWFSLFVATSSWAAPPSACSLLCYSPFFVPPLPSGFTEWRCCPRKATIGLSSGRGREVSCVLLNRLMLAYLGVCTYSLEVTGQRRGL